MKKGFTFVLNLFGIGLGTATLLGFLGKLFWLFDLFSHFRVQLFQLSLIFLFISLWQRMNRRAILFTAIALLNYAFVLPYYLGKPKPTSEQPVRAMLMNINAANGNTQQVLDAVKQFDPDLLLLEEVTPEWAEKLDQLKKIYPYRIAQPQSGCFGIMLLSKHKLKNERIEAVGSAGLPSIVTNVQLESGTITLIGTHPLPPIGARRAKERNQQLAALPDWVAQSEHPVLLIGDLNTSPWSPHFSRLLKDSGLKNSMKGFGFQPSWPVKGHLLRIPIDHLLHSPEITVHNRMIGSDVGSDHLPLIVDFSM